MQPGLPPHPREMREKCFRLFAEGRCYSDISYETRIPASTLRAWSARDAWRQRLTIQQNQPSLDTETAITLARQAAEPDIPYDLPSQQERYESNWRQAAVVLSEHVREMPANDLISRADKLHKADQTARKALHIEAAPAPTVINIALLSGSAGKQPRLVSDSSSQRALVDAPTSQDWP